MRRNKLIFSFQLLLVVGAVASSTRAAAKPSIDFLGVYDASGDDSRSHDVEDRFARALRSINGVRVWMPADLDSSSFGRDARLQLLASRAPGRRVLEYTKVLGDYVLLVTCHPDEKSTDGPEITTIPLLRVGDGAEALSHEYTNLDDDALSGIVKDLTVLVDPEQARPPAEVSEAGNTRLVFAPVLRASASTPTVISATAEGTGDVIASAIYRREEDASWHVVDLIKSDNNRYVGALPPMDPGHVLYYIHITDSDLNVLVSNGSEERPNRLLLANALPPVDTENLAAAPAPPSAPQELPAEAVHPTVPEPTNSAHSYMVAKWTTWAFALACAGGGAGLGFGTKLFYVNSPSVAEATNAMQYQIPVAALLGAAGALTVIGFGMYGLQVSQTPERTTVALSGTF